MGRSQQREPVLPKGGQNLDCEHPALRVSAGAGHSRVLVEPHNCKVWSSRTISTPTSVLRSFVGFPPGMQPGSARRPGGLCPSEPASLVHRPCQGLRALSLPGTPGLPESIVVTGAGRRLPPCRGTHTHPGILREAREGSLHHRAPERCRKHGWSHDGSPLPQQNPGGQPD